MPMNVHVHMSLVVKRSLALSEIPQMALSELVYLQSTVPGRGSNPDPKCRTHRAGQPGSQAVPTAFLTELHHLAGPSSASVGLRVPAFHSAAH